METPRYQVVIDGFFNIKIQDMKTHSTVCEVDYEEDAEFICECLNVTEYNR